MHDPYFKYRFLLFLNPKYKLKYGLSDKKNKWVRCGDCNPQNPVSSD